MRDPFPEIVEKGRIITAGKYGSNPKDRYGAFRIISKPTGSKLGVIVGNTDPVSLESVLAGNGKIPQWEHVSVSAANHIPLWQDMCYIKELFFKDEECVVQFHPPQSKYVNDNAYVLHLWRLIDGEFPMPPVEAV